MSEEYPIEEEFEEALKRNMFLSLKNAELQNKIDKAIKYINTTDKWLCRVNDDLCVVTIGKDKLLEILEGKE